MNSTKIKTDEAEINLDNAKIETGGVKIKLHNSNLHKGVEGEKEKENQNEQ